MTHNANKLAWRGTPGPWQVSLSKTSIRNEDRIVGNFQMEWASFENNPAVMEANAHMASAAPEAVEFIADLLEWIEHTDYSQEEVKAKIERAEEILKKAYNF